MQLSVNFVYTTWNSVNLIIIYLHSNKTINNLEERKFE